jgi:hypothetical protein
LKRGEVYNLKLKQNMFALQMHILCLIKKKHSYIQHVYIFFLKFLEKNTHFVNIKLYVNCKFQGDQTKFVVAMQKIPQTSNNVIQWLLLLTDFSFYELLSHILYFK